MTQPKSTRPPPEIVLADARKISCGGGGALGHPLVWYEIGKDDFIECKYCDRRFILKGGRADLHKD